MATSLTCVERRIFKKDSKGEHPKMIAIYDCSLKMKNNLILIALFNYEFEA
jgi:hypothetical protein